MKRLIYLFIIWLAMYGAALAQSFDTCMVVADLYSNYLAVDSRTDVCIEVVQIIDNTNMWTSGRAEYCVDSTGRIELPLPQGSRAWLYSDMIRGLQGSSLGKEVSVPASSSAMLVDYLPPTPVPPLHTIALNPSASMISDSAKALANGLSWLINPAAIAPGTNGYVLTMSGGVPTWAAAAGGSGDTTGLWLAVTVNAADISTNTSAISNQSADLLVHRGDINGLRDTSKSALDTAKAANVRSATNAGNIATNTADIATNTGNISTNTTNITAADDTAKAANVRSATNAGNIATNTAAIAGKQDALSAAELARLDTSYAPGTNVTFDIEGTVVKVNATGGGSDSLLNFRIIDSTSAIHSDTGRYSITDHYVARTPDKHSGSYRDGQKLGTVKIRIDFGNEPIGTVFSPTDFILRCDSVNGANIFSVTIDTRAYQYTVGTGMYKRSQVAYWGSADYTTITVSTFGQTGSTIADGAFAVPKPLGTNKAIEFLATGTNDIVSYFVVELTVDYLIPPGNHSTRPVFITDL